MSKKAIGGRRGVRRAPVLGWLQLARLYQKIGRASAAHLRQWDLSVAQFDVLAHVGASEGLIQQELADGLLVTKGNVCQLLDKMDRRGLIVRRPEGRTNRVFLTSAGRTMFEDVVPAQENLISEQLSALSVKEQRKLLELLGRLDRALS